MAGVVYWETAAGWPATSDAVQLGPDRVTLMRSAGSPRLDVFSGNPWASGPRRVSANPWAGEPRTHGSADRWTGGPRTHGPANRWASGPNICVSAAPWAGEPTPGFGGP